MHARACNGLEGLPGDNLNGLCCMLERYSKRTCEEHHVCQHELNFGKILCDFERSMPYCTTHHAPVSHVMLRWQSAGSAALEAWPLRHIDSLHTMIVQVLSLHTLPPDVCSGQPVLHHVLMASHFSQTI